MHSKLFRIKESIILSKSQLFGNLGDLNFWRWWSALIWAIMLKCIFSRAKFQYYYLLVILGIYFSSLYLFTLFRNYMFILNEMSQWFAKFLMKKFSWFIFQKCNKFGSILMGDFHQAKTPYLWRVSNYSSICIFVCPSFMPFEKANS